MTTFKFKWAYMTVANANMQYTSSVNIPIWNYTKLQKIVVYGALNNTTFILFDKTRNTNPAISTQTPTLNLHNELFEYEKLIDIGGTRYGQTYNKSFNYIDIINSKWETAWEPWRNKTFYVEYIYDDLGYDVSAYRTNNVPLQFIFKEYNFTASDVQQYKTIGYTASELKAAGIKFSVLLNGGYSMDDLFSALWNLYADNPNDFISYFNSLKTGNTTISAENALLKTANSSLSTENLSLSTANSSLNVENTLLKTANSSLSTENLSLSTANSSLNVENALLKTANSSLSTENASLSTEISSLSTENTLLKTENTLLKTEISNNTTNISNDIQCSIQICKWETL